MLTRTFLIFFIAIHVANIDAALYSKHLDPIRYNIEDVEDVSNIIKKAIKEKHWEIKQEKTNIITAWLNDYKGKEIIIDVEFDDRKIVFIEKVKRKIKCRLKKYCGIMDSNYYDWVLKLRQRITIELHRLAAKNILQDEELLQRFTNRLIKGSLESRELAIREVIDLKYYSEVVLETITKQIKMSLNIKNLKKREIPIYQYYLKALGKSNNFKYIEFLNMVGKDAKNRFIRKSAKYYKSYMIEQQKLIDKYKVQRSL